MVGAGSRVAEVSQELLVAADVKVGPQDAHLAVGCDTRVRVRVGAGIDGRRTGEVAVQHGAGASNTTAAPKRESEHSTGREGKKAKQGACGLQ